MAKEVYGESKLAFHPDKLEALSAGRITAPVYVRVKPTNRCNHHCFYCSYAPGSKCVVSETINLKDEIPREKMMELLSDFRDMGVRAVTYSGGGEPLVYPHITETLQKTLDYGIDLSMITNGQRLSEERAELLTQAKWIRISMDASTAKTFSEVRGVPERFFNELTENLKTFAKKKKPDCELGINFVVSDKNADQVYSSAKFFKELGANHVKFTPIYVAEDFLGYHAKSRDAVLAQIRKARAELEADRFSVFDTYEKDLTTSGLSTRQCSQCFIMQTVPVIGADCHVYFCHDKTYTRNGRLGSIKAQSFKNLWFSPEAEKIFRKFDPKQQCRHHCTYDPRNLAIQEMINHPGNPARYKPQTEVHKNFI